MCFNEAWKAIYIIYELLRFLFTIKKSNAQDKWLLERSNERTSKFVRNKFSALFSNFSTNCSMLPKPNQTKKKKNTKSIYIVRRTYNMLHKCLPSLSRSCSLAISITHHLGSTCSQVWIISSRGFSVFFGNEKTINHCANEVQLHLVRVWATLTSIFLMPIFFSFSFFLSFFIVKCNID